MILYICERCGRWQDMTLGAAIVSAFNNAFAKLKVPTHEDDGVPCPAGHGLMRMATADHRLAMWTSDEWKEEFGDATEETHKEPGNITLVDRC